MTALEYLEQKVQEDYENETLYNKIIIKEDLHNWKPGTSFFELKENKQCALRYRENEIPELNILNGPSRYNHAWQLEALFLDGYKYQERVPTDYTFSNSITLSFLKTYIDKHSFGVSTLCAARKKIFLMRAIKGHKKAYEKQVEKNGGKEVEDEYENIKMLIELNRRRRF